MVPLGVETTVVVSHSGADLGTRFWKNDLPPAPSGYRSSSTGRLRDRLHERALDGAVVLDQVELRLARAG